MKKNQLFEKKFRGFIALSLQRLFRGRNNTVPGIRTIGIIYEVSTVPVVLAKDSAVSRNEIGVGK